MTETVAETVSGVSPPPAQPLPDDLCERQAAFARRINRHKAYVTRLKQAGRLVMRGDLVVVQASIDKIAATASPEPRDQAAADAHALQRAQRAAQPAPPLDNLADVGLEHKRHAARKAKADADIAELQALAAQRKLIEADTVVNVVLGLARALRDLYAERRVRLGESPTQTQVRDWVDECNADAERLTRQRIKQLQAAE